MSDLTNPWRVRDNARLYIERKGLLVVIRSVPPVLGTTRICWRSIEAALKAHKKAKRRRKS